MIIYLQYNGVNYRSNFDDVQSGCDDEKLLNYICENYDQIECELNGDEYGEPKKCNHNLCIDCNVALTIDYQKLHHFVVFVAYLN